MEIAIRLENLSFGWHPLPPLLAIDRLELARGERVFLQGPSGSGKSTLLNLIGGVLTPDRGSVELLGRPLAPLRAAQRDSFRADHVGFVFQMFNLLPYLSLSENILLPCRFSALRKQRAEARFGSLPQAVAALLQHLGLAESLLQRPVGTLSMGQQQRVAVARALIGAPEILIADEPTSALDSAARDSFLQLLISECEAQRTTLLFVSHDAGLQRHFSRVEDLLQLNRAAEGAA